jgi:hypothetical protein
MQAFDLHCVFQTMFFFSDIEDLTHKTGNFKQFAIFVNMIETALSKVSVL